MGYAVPGATSGNAELDISGIQPPKFRCETQQKRRNEKSGAARLNERPGVPVLFEVRDRRGPGDYDDVGGLAQ